jgi:hypothetical protein
MNDAHHSPNGFPRIASCPGGHHGGTSGKPRQRWRRELGTGLAATALVLAAAGCSGSHAAGLASPSKSPSASPRQVAASQGPWKLVVPVKAGGLLLDEAAVQSGAYDQYTPSVPGVNKQLKSAGDARSDVFGIYDLKPASGDQPPSVVIFDGYDGTFNPQTIIHQTKTQLAGAKVAAAAAGPHGGSAICGNSGTGANAAGVCVWVTGTSYGVLLESGTGTQAVSAMPGLMVKMRTDVEIAPGTAQAAKSGQLLVRASGSAAGNSASFIASTDRLKVTYTFKCGAASLNYGNFIASLTPDHAGTDSYSQPIANLVGGGKAGTTIVAAPLGGARYHVSVISERGCDWSVVVRTD